MKSMHAHLLTPGNSAEEADISCGHHSLQPSQHGTPAPAFLSLAQFSTKAKFPLPRRVCILKGNRARLDLTLPLNRTKAAINSTHAKAGEKLSGTLTSFPAPSQCAPQPAPCTWSSLSCFSTPFQSSRGCCCQTECTHLERIELAQTQT